MNITNEDISHAIKFLIALILSITVHEFGHAWIATKLGDPTPKSQGRLTLSPLSHIDPIGTIVFPLIMALSPVALLGWGKPVETNPSYYTRRMSRATGSMLVAICGPLMNLAMAVLVSVLIVVGVQTGVLGFELAVGLFTYVVVLNLTLMFFNLLPIPPLDGGAVLAWVMPRNLQYIIDFLNRWGGLILLALVLTPGLSGYVLYPVRILADVWGRALFGMAGG